MELRPSRNCRRTSRATTPCRRWSLTRVIGEQSIITGRAIPSTATRFRPCYMLRVVVRLPPPPRNTICVRIAHRLNMEFVHRIDPHKIWGSRGGHGVHRDLQTAFRSVLKAYSMDTAAGHFSRVGFRRPRAMAVQLIRSACMRADGVEQLCGARRTRLIDFQQEVRASSMPVAISQVPSKCGSLIRPSTDRVRGFSKYVRITTTGGPSGHLRRFQLRGIFISGFGIMDGASDNDQDGVRCPPMQMRRIALWVSTTRAAASSVMGSLVLMGVETAAP